MVNTVLRLLLAGMQSLSETGDTFICCTDHSFSVSRLIAKRNRTMYTTNVVSKYTLRDGSSQKKEQEENRDDK